MDGLPSICAGLGLLDEDENGKIIGYVKGECCSDNLKDLLRFLRRDDPEKRDVFEQVCEWNIVGKDLIPIMEYCQEDRGLVLNAVKVLVFLTMPIEPTSIDIPQQIEYLWGLKYAITFSGIVPVIVSLLESPLENLESESFTKDDWKLVQLVLTLFRNILAIQDISTQQKSGGSATQFISLRDRFLELLFQENVMDLILVLSQHIGGSHGYLRQDNLLLLEIFYYIFKGQEPELIAKAHLKGSKVEEDAESSVTSLQYIMKEEKEKGKLTRFHNLSCYSKFTGTFTQVALDGSKALFKGNPSASDDALLKAHKNLRGPSKRGIWHHGELPSRKHKILELLKDFISEFLMGGYNVLMQSIRDDIDKEHQEIQSSDVVMFFQPSIDVETEASAACLHDSTLFSGTMCGPIAETLNESMFLMVISKWCYAFEGLKQTNDYKFLSAAGSLVKIMIRMLDLVLKQSPDDSKEPQTARILLYKLFYDQTEEGMTQFLLNLIKSFDTQKQSKSDLVDLVEIMHVVLRLLENRQARGTLRNGDGKRKRSQRQLYKEMTWSSLCKAAFEGSNFDLFELYVAKYLEKSKKLKFLKCRMKQIIKVDQCFLTTLSGPKSVEEIFACNKLSNEPSPAKEAAMPVSKSETSEAFFNNLSNRIQHGLESGMDLQNLAERLVKSSIHWLRHNCEDKNNSEGQESIRNSDNSCSEAVGEKLIKLLLILRAPKKMKKIHQDSSSEHAVREYEMQILLRLEILRSDISATLRESRKQKLLKQISSLLEILQYLVAGGIHGHVSLYDYVERTIRSRFSNELEDVVKEIYTRMDLLPFGDDDEAPNLLFNSDDSNQSWRDRHDRNENNSVSNEGKSSQPLANAFEETEKDEHTRILNEARERRERARRFAPVISKARDLQRVWAPKHPKSTKCKFDSLPKKSKRKDRQTSSRTVVHETPLTEHKHACLREKNNKGGKENSVSKSLFQDN